MLEKLKRATAGLLLHPVSRILRNGRVRPQTKDRLWRFAQRYATYFDISTDAQIVNGMMMRVSSRPRVEQEIHLFGEWEPLFTRYLQGIAPNDGIFLDVGANIGYFSLIASRIFREVHAIEASPVTCRRLNEIIATNKARNITVHPIAVGASEGHIDFYQHKEQSGGASTIMTEAHVFEARVPIAPLARILSGIDWGRVRFVKIDVEGLEAPVLDSLFELRNSLHPEVEIFVEFDPKRPATWAGIETFLAAGFHCAQMQGSYDRRDYTEPGRSTTLDPVIAPPSEFCDLLLRRFSTGSERNRA